MGEGPVTHPHQPPDSAAQVPGAKPKALSYRHPHVGWSSVGARQLEEAGATGLACRGAHSRLLTLSSLRSPGGPGVRSRSLWLVGRLFNGRIAVLWCVRGYGCRRAWPIVFSPTHGTRFLFRTLHAWPVLCWPACVWSVYGRVVFPAAVRLVPGCVSHLMVGLCVVGSIALQPARHSLMLSLLSSRLVLSFVVAVLSAVAVVLQPGCARRVVLVR